MRIVKIQNENIAFLSLRLLILIIIVLVWHYLTAEHRYQSYALSRQKIKKTKQWAEKKHTLFNSTILMMWLLLCILHTLHVIPISYHLCVTLAVLHCKQMKNQLSTYKSSLKLWHGNKNARQTMDGARVQLGGFFSLLRLLIVLKCSNIV